MGTHIKSCLLEPKSDPSSHRRRSKQYSSCNRKNGSAGNPNLQKREESACVPVKRRGEGRESPTIKKEKSRAKARHAKPCFLASFPFPSLHPTGLAPPFQYTPSTATALSRSMSKPTQRQPDRQAMQAARTTNTLVQPPTQTRDKTINRAMRSLAELEEEALVALDLLLQLEHPVEQRLGRRGAPRHVNVHRHDAVAAADDGV